jgi:hypothetical protein
MPSYKCAECGKQVDSEDTVWIDPKTGEATTGEKGNPYHVECAPNQREDFGTTIYKNPLCREGGYDAFEISSVADFTAADGTKTTEVMHDDSTLEEADGPVYFSLYGHIPGKGVECIGDFSTRQDAEDTLRKIGIID